VPHPWEEGEEYQLTAIAPRPRPHGPVPERPSWFGRRHADMDCRVCLGRFEPESVVNMLPCSHLFHRFCLESWLDYDHATCPLCRHRLLHAGADASSPALSLALAPRLATGPNRSA
jgi:RING/U-box domain-containing protein